MKINSKKYKATLLKVIMTSIIFLCMASSASAYALNGVYWQYEYAPFTIDSSVPSGWSTSLNSAMNEWNNAGTDFYFYSTGGQNNKIIYGTISGDYTAITQKWIYTGTNYLSKCVITFNSSKSWSSLTSDSCPSGMFDVQSTATHELGHCLSLGHSNVSDATMWQYGYPGTTWKRSLAQDDKNGIMAIY
ncbi:MAG: matrixin family metalloprotease [Methanosarcina sp.]|jgi:hypothetical protein